MKKTKLVHCHVKKSLSYICHVNSMSPATWIWKYNKERYEEDICAEECRVFVMRHVGHYAGVYEGGSCWIMVACLYTHTRFLHTPWPTLLTSSLLLAHPPP